MEELEKCFQEVRDYPEVLMPLSTVCRILGMKRGTMIRKLRDKEVASVNDGYRYYISKKEVFRLIRANSSALLGWITLRDFCKEHHISSKTVRHIIAYNKFERAKDLCRMVRLPPETVIKLEELLPSYISTDMMEKDGKTYYSLIKLSDEMARNLCRINTKLFKEHKERIYKTLHDWVREGLLPHIKTQGLVHLYVPDYVYEDMSGLIRIKDSAEISDRSRQTVHKWLKDGDLKSYKTVPGLRMVSATELDNLLLGDLQKEMMKALKDEPEKIEQLQNLYSPLWNAVIEASRRKADKALGKIKMDGGRRRAASVISKLRSQQYRDISLDAPSIRDDEEGPTYSERLLEEAESEDKPLYHLCDIERLNGSLERLVEEDRVLIERIFGIGDNTTAVPVSVIAEEQGEFVDDIQDRVDGILYSIREIYEENA